MVGTRSHTFLTQRGTLYERGTSYRHHCRHRVFSYVLVAKTSSYHCQVHGQASVLPFGVRAKISLMRVEKTYSRQLSSFYI